MVRKNIPEKCVICGKIFNRAYSVAKKTCSQECMKILRSRTQKESTRKARELCRKNNLCYTCRKKSEPIKCPHCKKTVAYMSRCKSCRERIRLSLLTEGDSE